MEYLKDSNWVWCPSWNSEDKEKPRIVFFRKSIDIDEKIKEAALHISADTRYKLYINGKFIEAGPSRGDLQIGFMIPLT